MEIIELKDHPFFVAVQYHPEYLSRPLRPSPPYLGLILAATGKLQSFLSKVRLLISQEVEIHQTLLSQFSLLAELFIGKVLVNNRDRRVLKLVNLNPGG